MAHDSSQENHRNLISSSGFSYLEASSNNPTFHTHLANQMQSFESNPELFNLTTGMEMLGFPSKNLHQRDGNSAMWKEFFSRPGSQGSGSSSSKTIAGSTSDFYQPYFNKLDFSEGTSENLIVAPELDYSSLKYVFPCEGNERPSQGLSLSLSSNKPSTIGLQSFELREMGDQQHQQQDYIGFSSNSRDGFFGRSVNQAGFFGKAANLHQTQFQLRNSKYLAPAQELLNEFCNLGTRQTDPSKRKVDKPNQCEDENTVKRSLYSIDFLELQKRKTKLFSMVEEVDRRYRQYCDQMKAVVSSFEAVAGTGAATVYSALASKAMSRHFRYIRDGIVGQIKAISKAMGEKDPVAPGTTRGETPRLKLVDQTLRQQRPFQQMGMMESHPWRPQRGLPERSVCVLRAWLFEHFLHPYPSDVDKHILARQTGLSKSQVSNWFINARVRLWKPMVEDMYLEETKEQEDNIASSDGVTSLEDNGRPNHNHKPTQIPQSHSEDQKPTLDKLVRGDSDSLSSIINNPDKELLQQHQQQLGRARETFGAVDLDFSSYNHRTTGSVSYSGDGIHRSVGNGVSLTLGLQQHGGSGVSLSFSPASQQSFFFPRDHIEDCESVQYSILDGEGQNLPYKNLVGAQLLHDLAG